MDLESFSARLKRRRRLWWSFRWQLRPSQLGNFLGRLRQHYLLLDAQDPVSRWHRGPHWQRALCNKWNSRQFALRLGCRVPELYWHGWLVSRIPFAALPAHYVLRPVMGHSRGGAFVVAGDFDLLRDRPVTAAGIRADVRRHQARFGFVPVLAEEFVRTEEGEYRLPVEYSFYSFAGTVGAILARKRISARECSWRYYTPEWQPFSEPIWTGKESEPMQPPPRCLGEMMAIASRLGAACGTYVRVDLYATDRGAVFGEFAFSQPVGSYTPFAEEYLGGLWQAHCPDAL